jgi:hypothetical protein
MAANQWADSAASMQPNVNAASATILEYPVNRVVPNMAGSPVLITRCHDNDMRAVRPAKSYVRENQVL